MAISTSKAGKFANVRPFPRRVSTRPERTAEASVPQLRLLLGRIGLTIVCFCCSCGPQNYLDGSIEEYFSLDFDRVDIMSTDHELAIVYVRGAPERDATNMGEEQVARVVIDVSELEIDSHTAIRDETFINHVHIVRLVVANESFPPSRTGEMTLEAFSLEPGETVKGQFDTVFVNGRVLLGAFEGTVTEPALVSAAGANEQP